MEKSEFSLTENKNSTKESYKLDEYDFLCLNKSTEFLKEEIEKNAMMLIFRTKLVCKEIERNQDEFWDRVNQTQELSKSDVERYAILKERMSDALRFNDKVESVYSNCEKLLEEVQILLKELL